MRSPIRFVHGNLVFGQDDVWALYRLSMVPYAGMARSQKVEVFASIAAMLSGLERDCQILRVSSRFSLPAYLAGVHATKHPGHAREDLLGRYLASHERALSGREIASPEAYLSVRLQDAASGAAGRFRGVLKGGLRLSLRDVLGGAITTARLRELEIREREVAGRIAGYVDCSRATSDDVRFLVLRSYGRGVEEPLRSAWAPQALLEKDASGQAQIAPLEHDILRLFETPITVGRRGLVMDLERTECHQAVLVLGDLPEEVSFPGPQAELLFAPLSSVGFPVDGAVWMRHVANRDALAMVRRRVIDADNAWREEATGDHGPGSHTSQRPHVARQLEDHLLAGGRPPLLSSTVSLCLGAKSAAELEERIEELRAAYGGVTLHRPMGDQLRFWAAHLPGQGVPVPDYDDYRLVESVAAMVPTATHQVGTREGPYLGHTLSGGQQPVLFDLTAASRSARPPSILVCGTLGSGKTMLLQLLLYQAFLLGSRIVDIDPKGDHRLHELPGMAEVTEVVELGGDARYRGLLDPLSIAPAEMAVDVCLAWLFALLPQPVAGEWQIEVRRAVTEEVATSTRPTSMGVVARLAAAGSTAARAAGSALSVYATGGLAQLGFADAQGEETRLPDAEVTLLRVRNLPRPAPGTPRGDLTEDERIGQAILRLLATYAMHVMGKDRTRHKVIGIDESFFLLQDQSGRRMIEQLNRWARSEFATPILITHLVSDAEELDNLLGARIFMGQESEVEAARALSLLHLDGDDAQLRQRLLGFRQGACMLRDYEGRVGQIQVHAPDQDLLRALDTTPG